MLYVVLTYNWSFPQPSSLLITKTVICIKCWKKASGRREEEVHQDGQQHGHGRCYFEERVLHTLHTKPHIPNWALHSLIIATQTPCLPSKPGYNYVQESCYLHRNRNCPKMKTKTCTVSCWTFCSKRREFVESKQCTNYSSYPSTSRPSLVRLSKIPSSGEKNSGGTEKLTLNNDNDCAPLDRWDASAASCWGIKMNTPKKVHRWGGGILSVSVK